MLEDNTEDERDRREAGQRELAYANECFGEVPYLKRWDALFETLL